MQVNQLWHRLRAQALIASSVFLGLAWSAPLAASEPQQANCIDNLSYQLSYKGSKVGHVNRQQVWQDGMIKASTSGKVSFLMFKFRGVHQATVQWNQIQNRYLTRAYEQDVKGLSTTSIQTTFSENGLTSKLTLNGETTDYADLEHPIVDFEAISLQMRHYVMAQNRDEFDFVLQKSDETSRYFFQAQGEETIKVSGKEIKAIKISQVRKKDRKLHLWFAPELNYQLVKGSYKRKIIDIEAELTEHKLECQSEEPKVES